MMKAFNLTLLGASLTLIVQVKNKCLEHITLLICRPIISPVHQTLYVGHQSQGIYQI